DILRFSISVFLTDRKTGFSWKLVVVYGSPYEEGIGGVFRGIGTVMRKVMVELTISGLMLLIVSLAFNGCFTWTNNQEYVVKAKLDRVLVSPSWDAVFPLAKVSLLDRFPSDHNPLLIEIGTNMFFGKKKF
ncbi:hypothetical protein U9M48_006020, partial [Paspalum notatum var. saurae]